MHYTKIKRIKSKKLLIDYFTTLTLFKPGGTRSYNIDDISKKEIKDFLSKFYDNKTSNNIDKHKYFIEFFELKEDEYNLYNSVLCLLDDLLVVHQVRNNKKAIIKNITFKDQDYKIEFYKKYKSYYIVIDDLFALCYNSNGVLCSLSIISSSLYYSYLGSLDEYYLNIEGLRDASEFIDLII